ncbi:hypothetical protein DV517_74560 [Streptomyces sp. S816]|nr:hypothetical protein DV517_74560 [Streptomyces sp. S816]
MPVARRRAAPWTGRYDVAVHVRAHRTRDIDPFALVLIYSDTALTRTLQCPRMRIHGSWTAAD